MSSLISSFLFGLQIGRQKRHTSKESGPLRLRVRVQFLACLVPLVTALSALAGCGGGSALSTSSSSTSASSATTKAAVLKSNVKVLPLGKVQVSNLTATAVTLTGSLPPLKIGDVIYGSDGPGLLRKVVSAIQSGNSAVVQTSNASLEEVFQEAHIDTNRLIDGSLHPVFTSAQPGVTLSYGPPGKKAQTALLAARKASGRASRTTRADIATNHLMVGFGPWNVALPGGRCLSMAWRRWTTAFTPRSTFPAGRHSTYCSRLM